MLIRLTPNFAENCQYRDRLKRRRSHPIQVAFFEQKHQDKDLGLLFQSIRKTLSVSHCVHPQAIETKMS